MPQPTQSQVHVDTLLTNQLIGFRNAAYIADDAAPIVPVSKQTNIIAQVNQSAFFRDDAKIRQIGTRSRRSGFTVANTLTYKCDRYALGMDIPDEVRDNADQPYDLDRDAAFFVTSAVQLARERAFASELFTTGVWGNDYTGGTNFNQWSNYAASDPLSDVTSYMDVIEGLIGKEANTLIIGKQVWAGSGGLANGGGLKWHPAMIDTLKYTQRGQLDVATAASLFGLERILIGRAIYTTTVEGVAESSVTYSRVFGKNGLLYYGTSGPSIFDSPAMSTYVWNRVAGAVQYIKRLRDEQTETDTIEANSYFDHKRLVANAGVFLSGVVN